MNYLGRDLLLPIIQKNVHNIVCKEVVHTLRSFLRTNTDGWTFSDMPLTRETGGSNIDMNNTTHFAVIAFRPKTVHFVNESLVLMSENKGTCVCVVPTPSTLQKKCTSRL